ncbi:hypothetical protein ABDK00_001645 [Niabella insulamsoli]|uniref:hypothetical protein n=1 Tax=Niabella insulamsoli TaxID=3144874 RepID=UPI0031FD0A87
MNSNQPQNETDVIIPSDNETVIIPEDAKPISSESDKSKLSGYQSPEQIEELKKKHGGEIHEVEVDGKLAYFKKASRPTLRAALSFLDKDKLKYMEIILINCFVAGDRSVLENDEDMYGIVDVVPALTKGKLAKIKKF